jgi:hypothetical protein
LLAVLILGASAASAGQDPPDWRNIRAGHEIPSENYTDQPYVVVTADGSWLCTLTTGRGNEGHKGQHVVATISTDKGKTWSDLIDIEPADGPEASWVMPLISPAGRVYAFYNYNGDNIRMHPNGREIRADVLGWYCYRYSDDNGRTWSRRHRLPVRRTACDRTNGWAGEVQLFWGIAKPIVHDNSVFLAFTKLGRHMLDNGEGWFFHSDNIFNEPDPSRIDWQMLPDGDHGLRLPEFGSVQEEHNIVALSNGDLYCMYRTTIGHPVHSYSRDGGHTWTKPEIATYTPGGRQFKHPRACPRIWRANNGKYLFWFHNHGGKDYKGRNPVWICGGIEKDGCIHWSQPEIMLYDDDPQVRISYPDLIEQDGQYWITETQKTIARVHRIDPTLLEGLWRQPGSKEVTKTGLLLSMGTSGAESPPPTGRLGSLDAGFTIEFWIRFDDLSPGQVILDTRDDSCKGIVVTTTDVRTVQVELSDGQYKSAWDCDPGLFKPRVLHHIVFIVDGGPKIISIVVDGVLCDGGRYRQYGWGRIHPKLTDIKTSVPLRIGPSISGRLELVRIYKCYLRTSQAVANFHARLQPPHAER